MEEPGKGTMTQLSSLFPADEAHRASRLVQDTILERAKELNQLQGFVGENTSLINLVQKLPDNLHHEIMVPFGKAAFFPGRLVHTNEFLVLLGEGYYADRTSKQTIDILKRREKVLDAQVESLKAVMEDLKAEASFFDSTAVEATQGLVEIREDYVPAVKMTKIDNSATTVVEEDEYARMMSRFDELEREELAAGSMDESDKDENFPVEIAKGKVEDECFKVFLEKKEVHTSSKDLQSKTKFQQRSEDHVENQPIQVAHEVTSIVDDSSSAQGLKENIGVETQPLNKVQAFTGSIVEHTHNLREKGNLSSNPTSTSKPVSRFKMQRK